MTVIATWYLVVINLLVLINIRLGYFEQLIITIKITQKAYNGEINKITGKFLKTESKQGNCNSNTMFRYLKFDSFLLIIDHIILSHL